MNTYDQLTFLLVNKMLSCFGLRLKTDGTLVYIFRIRNYAYAYEREHVSVIPIEGDISDAFLFLNMDYDDYKVQKFETIFEYTTWFTDNCKYLTVELLRGIEKEVKDIPKKDLQDVQRALLRFIDTVKIGHIILRDFHYLPILMYPNLREKIIRNYFQSEELDNKIIDLKLLYTKEEAQNKFSPLHIITWIRPLKSQGELTSIFVQSFINYITKNKMNDFPRFLVDTDSNIVKQEVISYYYNLFHETNAYKLYVAKHNTNEVEGAEIAL